MLKEILNYTRRFNGWDFIPPILKNIKLSSRNGIYLDSSGKPYLEIIWEDNKFIVNLLLPGGEKEFLSKGLIYNGQVFPQENPRITSLGTVRGNFTRKLGKDTNILLLGPDVPENHKKIQKALKYGIPIIRDSAILEYLYGIS